MARRDMMTIHNAEIGYSDFKGSRYSPVFMLIMNKGEITYKGITGYTDYDQLIEDGWRIERSKRDEDELIMWVTINMNPPQGVMPPSIYAVTGKKKEKLNEDTLGILDSADVSKFDVTLNPWPRKDGEGYTAYLKTLFAFLYEDPLMAEYGMYDEDNQSPDAYAAPVDDDIPF